MKAVALAALIFAVSMSFMAPVAFPEGKGAAGTALRVTTSRDAKFLKRNSSTKKVSSVCGPKAASGNVALRMWGYEEYTFSPTNKIYTDWGNRSIAVGTTGYEGQLDGDHFSSSYDYEDALGKRHWGEVEIVLDAPFSTASKVTSFYGVLNEKQGICEFTEEIRGGNVQLAERNNYSLLFKVQGQQACSYLTEPAKQFSHQYWMGGPEEVDVTLKDYRCDQNSFLSLKIEVCDPCASKIPVPKGLTAFPTEDSASPILGTDPSEISPVGFGGMATGGGTGTYHVQFCPFEGPVDIYFQFEVSYLLDENNKVSVAEKMKPWRVNVTDAIDEQIAWDFGGLFHGDRLPKGDYSLDIFVVPKGGEFFKVFMGEGDGYSWNYVVATGCGDEDIPMPTGNEIFMIDQPLAMLTTGSDPRQIIPFSVGPYALGGELLRMQVDFCPFDEHVDTHFGIYCPGDDPLNIYFVNGEAKEEKDLFQKVSILRFAFSPKLPEGAFGEEDNFDNLQNSETTFFVGLGSTLPKGSCHYIAAVTPAGVRDRFYAWVLPLDINIKQAFIDLWKQGQKTSGSIKEHRKR